ncbi:MAG: cobalamin-binding protein [Planctomycetes bacterium]|nr:cobalamin-binding protein [Planctomycetota bacterium]
MKRRIVSLCPSLTELVFDLGAGEELAGITEWCVHPAARVGAIEKVGGTKNPCVGRIVTLAPDLVLMNEEENRVEDAQALEAAGLRVHSSFPKDTDGTAEMVRSIGAALGRAAAAEAIAKDIERRAARVRSAAAGQREMGWAYLIWRQPWMSVNRDTFVDALLALAGGRNVFGARAERYPKITLEELARLAPERVFLCTEPFSFKPEHADELAQATGLPRERFVIADGEYLSWHGSRTPDGIDYAEGLIRAARAESK